jgi:hypothetical protein
MCAVSANDFHMLFDAAHICHLGVPSVTRQLQRFRSASVQINGHLTKNRGTPSAMGNDV